MTPEQLREWAAYLAGRGSVWTLPEGMPKPSDVFRAHADALDRLASIEAAQGEDVREFLSELALVASACSEHAEDENLGVMVRAACGSAAKRLRRSAALIESLAARNAELFEQVAALTEERDWYSTANERAERAEAALAESERKCERLKFHAEAMAHYTDCYASKWPDSGANYTLEAYRAEFKE